MTSNSMSTAPTDRRFDIKFDVNGVSERNGLCARQPTQHSYAAHRATDGHTIRHRPSVRWMLLSSQTSAKKDPQKIFLGAKGVTRPTLASPGASQVCPHASMGHRICVDICVTAVLLLPGHNLWVCTPTIVSPGGTRSRISPEKCTLL